MDAVQFVSGTRYTVALLNTGKTCTSAFAAGSDAMRVLMSSRQVEYHVISKMIPTDEIFVFCGEDKDIVVEERKALREGE